MEITHIPAGFCLGLASLPRPEIGLGQMQDQSTRERWE